jgi:RNA polymerase sigma-70 factor, ECF subfamily
VDDLTQLAHAARAGDRQALEQLITRTYQQVWAFCAAVVGPDRAETLTETVFVQGVESLPKFWGKAEAQTWLLTIARRTCLDDLRARRPRRPARHSPSDSTHQPLPGGPHATIHELVEPLDTTHRVVFALTQVAALSYQQAAEVCGCPRDIIRLNMIEARETLFKGSGETTG